jgi:glucose-6-phosphate dehydrogenase assembly protein OpcA
VVDAISPPIPGTEPLVTRWTAPSIEVARVRAELGRLWEAWTARYGEPVGIAQTGHRDQVYMRPSTVNLIAIVESEEEAARTADVLASLPDYSASRSIVLCRNAGGGDGPFGVRIAISERVLHRSSAPTRVEVITLSAPPGNDDLMASIASPLLVPDLPDVLYVPAEPFARNPLVQSLLDRSDGLLVDTVEIERVGETLAFLSEVPATRSRLGLGDLVWTRLRTWRDLVAQFYDQPAALASLEQIDEVRIVYAPPDGSGRSGLTAGLLFAGWLASRLEWRTPGELIPSGDAFRLTLRAGGRGKSREVLLHLSAGTSPFSCSSLERVRLSSQGPESCVFDVHRTDESAITTFSSTPQAADLTRLVHASCPSDRVILAAKLRRLRIDPVYLKALEVAATLWPEGFES